MVVRKNNLKTPISLSHQIIAMKKKFPGFNGNWNKGVVVWEGKLQPSELSDIYLIRIRFSLNMRQPEVWIVSPTLQKRDGIEPIPHTYARDRLCLFRPRKKEWGKHLLIANTIVPWASLWLFYYEMWLATGEWLGGGEHPNSAKGERLDVQNIID
jgi:hypothetical protein